MKKNLICILAACLGAGAFSLAKAETVPLWLRDAKISPDGKNIAFTWEKSSAQKNS